MLREAQSTSVDMVPHRLSRGLSVPLLNQLQHYLVLSDHLMGADHPVDRARNSLSLARQSTLTKEQYQPDLARLELLS